ncbi:MAG: hypothetical protein ACR2G5_06850, partial [Pyrinomonadaceae bacterium]
GPSAEIYWHYFVLIMFTMLTATVVTPERIPTAVTNTASNFSFLIGFVVAALFVGYLNYDLSAA